MTLRSWSVSHCPKHHQLSGQVPDSHGQVCLPLLSAQRSDHILFHKANCILMQLEQSKTCSADSRPGALANAS